MDRPVFNFGVTKDKRAFFATMKVHYDESHKEKIKQNIRRDVENPKVITHRGWLNTVLKARKRGKEAMEALIADRQKKTANSHFYTIELPATPEAIKTANRGDWAITMYYKLLSDNLNASDKLVEMRIAMDNAFRDFFQQSNLPDTGLIRLLGATVTKGYMSDDQIISAVDKSEVAFEKLIKKAEEAPENAINKELMQILLKEKERKAALEKEIAELQKEITASAMNVPLGSKVAWAEADNSSRALPPISL